MKIEVEYVFFVAQWSGIGSILCGSGNSGLSKGVELGWGRMLAWWGCMRVVEVGPALWCGGLPLSCGGSFLVVWGAARLVRG